MAAFTFERPAPGVAITPTVSCRLCPTKHHLPFSGRTPPPAVLQKRAKADGWEKHGQRAWTCPKCQEKRQAARAAPQAPLRPIGQGVFSEIRHQGVTVNDVHNALKIAYGRVREKAKTPPPGFAIATAVFAHIGGERQSHAAAKIGVAQETISQWGRRIGVSNGKVVSPSILKPAPETETMNAIVPASNVTPNRTLSPKEAARLSIELDGCFDAEVGKYTKGASDQTVAEKLDLPRANVTAFRDEAFGPLKTNPDVDKAMEILARVETEYAAARPDVERLAARIARIEAGLKEATALLDRAGA